MKGHLILSVNYSGKKLEFEDELLKSKFGFKFKLNVDGVDVVLQLLNRQV